MRSLFKSNVTSGQQRQGEREAQALQRMASYLQKHLAASEGLRILDIEARPRRSTLTTSPVLAIAFIWPAWWTKAAKPEWKTTGEDGAPRLDVEAFLAANLNFVDRKFDVVTFWDTADYLSTELLQPILATIHEAMNPGGLMLALLPCQGQRRGRRASRAYHPDSTDAIEIQRVATHPLLHTYSNRQIEQLLHAFSRHTASSWRKDNLSEVVATR